MAFIPIDAKADVQDSKKGKLTPYQHAQLNAWCLANKTGILDCLDKCEYNASTTSLVPDNNKVTVKFKKGYLVICGRLIECEAETEVEITTPTTGSETGWIIAKYDLSATGNNEFVVAQKKTSQGGLVQEDLNNNPVTGVYEFPLYDYTATSSLVTLTRTGDYIPDIGGKLEDFITAITGIGGKLEDFITAITGTGMTGTGNPPLQGYNKSKGTIEERFIPLTDYDNTKGTIETRLTNLGFKSGTVTLSSGVTASVNTITRQGNYVIGYISASKNIFYRDFDVGTLSSYFRPKTNISFYSSVKVYDSDEAMFYFVHATVTINTNGVIHLSLNSNGGTSITEIKINFGFEANPIT